MKTFTKINLLLIGFVLLNVNISKAVNQGSELNLKMHDNSVFSVHFDNNSFQYSDSRFSIANVKPGKHHLKVVKHIPAQRGRVMITKTVYNGWVTIPPASKVFAVIGYYNDYNVVDVVSLKPTHHRRGAHQGYANNNTYNNSSCPVPQQGPAYLVMSDNDFYSLKSVVANASFDSNKLMIAKQAIANNYLTAAQVAELANLMSFESNKLDLAKSAYTFTVDKQNYFLLNNVFSFSSSIRELNNYISSVG